MYKSKYLKYKKKYLELKKIVYGGASLFDPNTEKPNTPWGTVPSQTQAQSLSSSYTYTEYPTLGEVPPLKTATNEKKEDNFIPVIKNKRQISLPNDYIDHLYEKGLLLDEIAFLRTVSRNQRLSITKAKLKHDKDKTVELYHKYETMGKDITKEKKERIFYLLKAIYMRIQYSAVKYENNELEMDDSHAEAIQYIIGILKDIDETILPVDLNNEDASTAYLSAFMTSFTESEDKQELKKDTPDQSSVNHFNYFRSVSTSSEEGV